MSPMKKRGKISDRKTKTKKFKIILYNFYSFFALSAFFSD